MRAKFSLLVALLTGCPPPEVLYGIEIYDEAAPAGGVPTLPTALSDAPRGDGVLIQVDRAIRSSQGATPAQVSATDHVTFSGTIRCDACVESLVLHVVPLDPTGAAPPPGSLAGGPGRTPLVTAKVHAGAFSLPVPTVGVPVAIELLVDVDGDLLPTPGERYVRVLDPRAPLWTHSDHTDLLLDASDRPTGRDSRPGRRPSGPDGKNLARDAAGQGR